MRRCCSSAVDQAGGQAACIILTGRDSELQNGAGTGHLATTGLATIGAQAPWLADRQGVGDELLLLPQRLRAQKTRLSEHGKANALDIGAFITADGARTDLLAHWGATERDIVAAAKKLEAERKQPGKAATITQRAALTNRTAGRSALVSQHGGRQTATVPPIASLGKPARRNKRRRRPNPNAQDGIDNFPSWYRDPSEASTATVSAPAIAQSATAIEAPRLVPPVPERRPSLRQRYLWAKAKRDRRTVVQSRQSRDQYRDKLNDFLSYRNDLGGPKLKGKRQRGDADKGSAANRAAFLRGAHRTACRIFGTVLGPEANDAHRNHFHVDLAPRRRSNYCR